MAPDTFSTEKRSEIMARIKAFDTVPELKLRKALWRRGARYRLHQKHLPGKPDIVFPGAKVAVFVDSDFWHGKIPEERLDRMSDYWKQKLRRNRVRDREVNVQLDSQGWTVVRVEERDVRRDAEASADNVLRVVEANR